MFRAIRWLCALFYNPSEVDTFRSVPVDPAFRIGTAFAVSAVPEPETYALLLAELGLLGFTAHRRKQKAAA